jgi:hypothetical protein
MKATSNTQEDYTMAASQQSSLAPTDDTTLDDEYEITRLNALPPELQDLAALHAIDQFQAVPSYIERFSEPSRP